MIFLSPIFIISLICSSSFFSFSFSLCRLPIGSSAVFRSSFELSFAREKTGRDESLHQDDDNIDVVLGVEVFLFLLLFLAPIEYVGMTSPALRSRLTPFPLAVDLEQSIMAYIIALSSAVIGTTTDPTILPVLDETTSLSCHRRSCRSCRKLPNFVQSNGASWVRFSTEKSRGLAFSFMAVSVTKILRRLISCFLDPFCQYCSKMPILNSRYHGLH
mmetsp:Transcript_14469/g.16747  ORF Transcript_14469/g.16747 Transcript_14469/m.16747 type:complete len:216 (-) Transcript_14469:16-663(-)